MQVTEEYLAWLEKDSRNLIKCKPAEVKRSRTYDLKKPTDRIALAQIAARIGIEGLYQYPKHRGRGTKLIDRLCLTKPM